MAAIKRLWWRCPCPLNFYISGSFGFPAEVEVQIACSCLFDMAPSRADVRFFAAPEARTSRSW